MNDTNWENYGHGNDPRCEHCMVPLRLRAGGRAGRQPPLGDTLKMLLWQLT